MAIKTFISIDENDAPEVKAGKEVMNAAFNALDNETKSSLEQYQKAQGEHINSIMQKSVETEKALKAYIENSEKESKSRDEQITELKNALVEMNKAKVEQEKTRRVSFADSIMESMDGKQDAVNAFLKNKNSGFQQEIKAVGNMGVVTNAVAPQFTSIVGPAHELIHARNYIPVSPTISNLIRYVQFTNKDGNVEPVVGYSTLKPQFDYTETVVDAPVIKLAGWINVADEFLEDIVGAMSFLSADLPQKLYDAEDQQIFKGSGATGNLTGLYTSATALSLPYAGVSNSSNNIDKLAAAATYVRRQKRMTTAAWTSPEDYLAILINKASGSGEYTYPVRFNSTNNMLYIGDFPVIQHTVFNPSEGFVGDFATGARIFQKSDATLRFSTENVDNFVKNVTTVLVEERIALCNFYPESFVKVSLSAYNS